MLRKGFTLIELLIVLAIIGILASLAIPMYQDYTIRTQVSEGLSLAAPAKTAVATFFAERAALPTSNAEAGFGGASGRYTSSVTIGAGGVITVIYGGTNATGALNGAQLTLTPTGAASQVTWKCAASTKMQSTWLPGSCR